jgi:Fe-S-cluster containining protein
VTAEEKEEECLRCGRCCRYGWSVNARRSDLLRWLSEGRKDILRFFEAYLMNGEYVNCSSLSKPEEAYQVLWTDMIDPTTEDYYTDCPFLTEMDNNQYACSIQDTKPEICTRFRPWQWDERGKEYPCPAVAINQEKRRRAGFKSKAILQRPG